jgi:hypothetical protein
MLKLHIVMESFSNIYYPATEAELKHGSRYRRCGGVYGGLEWDLVSETACVLGFYRFEDETLLQSLLSHFAVTS